VSDCAESHWPLSKLSIQIQQHAYLAWDHCRGTWLLSFPAVTPSPQHALQQQQQVSAGALAARTVRLHDMCQSEDVRFAHPLQRQQHQHLSQCIPPFSNLIQELHGLAA
jgi:hypothetical protein